MARLSPRNATDQTASYPRPRNETRQRPAEPCSRVPANPLPHLCRPPTGDRLGRCWFFLAEGTGLWPPQ